MMIRDDSGTPVWVSGEGRTVILLHGVLVDHRMWGRQVAALAPHYRVCCPDMLGHGAAHNPPGARVLEDFVAQVQGVVTRFSDQGAPVLIGFSMGGLIAQAYAVRHPATLSGLVLMNTVHDRSPAESARVIARFDGNVARGVENAIESGTRRWFTEQDQETEAELIKDVQSWMREGDFAAKCKAHGVFARSDGAVTGKLGAISCPTLIMTGADDGGSTPKMARQMAGSIANAELRIVDGQRHMMPLLDAARVNALLLGFLSSCWPE